MLIPCYLFCAYLGISMVMMRISTNGLNQLPLHLYPHGTAMNNTLNQVAGAIGTALLVTIMTNRTESQAKELGAIAMQNMTEQPTQEALAANATEYPDASHFRGN